MIRAIKLRIYPNEAEQVQIKKTIGSSRLLYNLMLAERIDVYEQLKDDKETLHNYQYKTERQYKEEYPFLKEADSIALQASREHLENAYAHFFNGLKKGRKVGYPRFKSKKGKETYTTKQVNNNIKIDFENKKIKLPKLRWLNYRDNRSFSERIKHATISRTKSNKYFVSLTLEAQEDIPLKQIIHEEDIIAFDMSAKEFLVNDAIRLRNPRFYRSEEKKTRKLHKNLTRKEKDSRNWEKARLKLAKHYEKICDRKKDWTHKLTRTLADNYDAVILEDLNIKGMQQFNSGLSKSVSLDFSWHQFKTYLEYKMAWLGKHFVLVDRFFASSKLCSHCGQKTNDLSLEERVWTCSFCGTFHERDENASMNLKTEGVRILKKENHITVITHNDTRTAGTAGSQAFGEDVRPIKILESCLGNFL